MPDDVRNIAPQPGTVNTGTNSTRIKDTRLIEQGYEPVAVSGKRALGDGWSTRPNTVEAIAAERAALPNAISTGLRTGRLVGVDIDVIDADHVAALRKLADTVLGWTIVERIGSKGMMLCYRNETPISKITIGATDGDLPFKRRKVEILGTGQQFVAYGIHPDTGRPYAWPNAVLGCGEPMDVPLAELREVTPDALRTFAGRVATLFAELGYTNATISDRGTHAAAREAKRREDKVPVPRETLIDILGYISPDCDRTAAGGWISRLGSIQATQLRDVPAELMDGELIEIAQAWSRGDYTGGTAPENWRGDDDVEFNYNTLAPDRLGGSTFGSLYHAACESGYAKPPPEPTDEEVFGDPAQYAEYVGKSEAASDTTVADDEVNLLCGADVTPEEIKWLFPGHYALGKFHVLAGKPEAGKNLLCINTAAILSVGGKWPDGTQAPLGDTIIWSGEDSFRDTTLPRFLAAGGDRARIHCVCDVKTVNGQKRPFDPARDVPRLCRAARKLPALRYVIIDPVSVVVAGGRGASNNNAETRRALQPLIDLAEERGIVVEGITHFAKDSGKRDVLERVIESTAFTAVARVVHVAHKFEDETKLRRWVRIKCNIAKSGGGVIVGFEYAPEEVAVPGYSHIRAPHLTWGEQLHGSARALIAEDTEPSAVSNAAGFLETILRGNGGTIMTMDLEKAAKAHGHSWASVVRARTSLGDRVVIGKNLGATYGGWFWHLTDPKPHAADPW